MRGILRVIPVPGSGRPSRITTLRQIPSPVFIEQLLGSEPGRITTLDTILTKDGSARPCIAYAATGGGFGTKEMNLSPNTWASLLRLQAQVRKDGFSEVDPDHPTIRGPVVILYGDEEFMDALEADTAPAL